MGVVRYTFLKHPQQFRATAYYLRWPRKYLIQLIKIYDNKMYNYFWKHVEWLPHTVPARKYLGEIKVQKAITCSLDYQQNHQKKAIVRFRWWSAVIIKFTSCNERCNFEHCGIALCIENLLLLVKTWIPRIASRNVFVLKIKVVMFEKYPSIKKKRYGVNSSTIPPTLV